MTDSPARSTAAENKSVTLRHQGHQPTYEIQDDKNHFYAARWDLPPHRRRTGCQLNHILVYWMGNTRIAKTAGGHTLRREAHPGNVTFIPGGEYANYLFEDKNVFFEMHLPPMLLHTFSERTLGRSPSIQPFGTEEDAWLSAYFHMLQAEIELYRGDKQPIDSLLIGQALQLLLAHLTRRYFSADASQSEGSRLQHVSALRPHLLKRVTDYVRDHVGADIHIADLAALVFLSDAHFIRAFTAATGLTPYQYVIEKRLDAGAELLLTDDTLSIADIATRLGFKSQSHFATKFKTRYGVTPSGYRRRQ